MPQRCSFCGAWENSSARRCEKCGERLHPPSGTLQRVFRLGLVLVGAVLVGLNLRDVLEPLMNSRVVLDPSTAWAFLAGVIALTIGFVWR